MKLTIIRSARAAEGEMFKAQVEEKNNLVMLRSNGIHKSSENTQLFLVFFKIYEENKNLEELL